MAFHRPQEQCCKSSFVQAPRCHLVAASLSGLIDDLYRGITFMGGVFAWQRRASGGVQAPMITHTVWSYLMVRHVPPLFHDRGARKRYEIGARHARRVSQAFSCATGTLARELT